MRMTHDNRKTSLLILPVSVLLLFPTISPAQSLGEIARQYRKEREEREKRGEVPVKVFTNDDIAWTKATTGTPETAPPESTAQEAKQTRQPPENEAAATPSSPSDQPAAAGQDYTKSKEYWQARFKAAHAALSHAKEEQTLVEDELRLLQIQQARELDPERSRILNSGIDAKTIEVESRRAATEKARVALEEIEKEFKQSGAPQDWIDSAKYQN